MKPYVAKTAHSQPCVLCDDKILPGDVVQPWTWWNYEGDKGVPFGGICRVHACCYAIGAREGCMEEELTTFATMDERRHDQSDDYEKDNPYLLLNEADAALKKERAR
jgi:hypothetical protein